MTFDSAALEEDFEILGSPMLTLEVASDRPVALIAVRRGFAKFGKSTRRARLLSDIDRIILSRSRPRRSRGLSEGERCRRTAADPAGAEPGWCGPFLDRSTVEAPGDLKENDRVDTLLVSWGRCAGACLSAAHGGCAELRDARCGRADGSVRGTGERKPVTRTMPGTSTRWSRTDEKTMTTYTSEEMLGPARGRSPL